jgi:hypothetical protein
MSSPVNLELVKIMLLLGVAIGLIVTVALWAFLDRKGGNNG